MFVFGVCLSSYSQTYKMTVGEEIKLKKGTGDLDIIFADQSGLYFTEERSAASMFSLGRPALAHKLYKLDRNYAEVFEKDYKKELKGLEFQSFQALGEELYIFATDYIKRDRRFFVYGARIDKNTGDLQGDFAELGSYDLESKKDDYEMKVSPVKNGRSFVMVSNISAKDRVSIGVLLLDKSLKKIENAVINLSFPPNLYELQDVQFTQNNRVVLLGKEFEETQVGKKKKRRRYIFKQYVMGIYSKTGQKEKDVVLDSEERYIISGKLIEQPNGQMLLAGFYSKNAKKTDLNGFYINRVDPEKGELLLSSFKEINPEMLGRAYEDEADEDDETKDFKKQANKARDNDEEDEFPNNFVIRSVDISPTDNSIVITSEVFKYYLSVYTTSSYNAATRTTSYNTTYTHRFLNQDILLIHADQDGNIKWLNALPKSQSEIIRSSSGGSAGFSYQYDKSSYFAGAGALPYYSSFKSLILNNTLILVLNDHTSNNVNAQYGDKVKTIYNFRKKSNVYGISVDLQSGKMTRKVIGSNNEETVLMPRHAFNVKNELVIPSWRLRMIGKTQLRFAKISVK